MKYYFIVINSISDYEYHYIVYMYRRIMCVCIISVITLEPFIAGNNKLLSMVFVLFCVRFDKNRREWTHIFVAVVHLLIWMYTETRNTQAFWHSIDTANHSKFTVIHNKRIRERDWWTNAHGNSVSYNDNQSSEVKINISATPSNPILINFFFLSFLQIIIIIWHEWSLSLRTPFQVPLQIFLYKLNDNEYQSYLLFILLA